MTRSIPSLTRFAAALLALCAAPAVAADAPREAAQICRMDWNHDGEGDLTVFAPAGEQGYELLVVYAVRGRDTWVRVHASDRWVAPVMTCKTDANVTAGRAGPGEAEPATHQTGGSYIEIAEPEGPAVAFFWDGSVREVWTTD